MSTIGQIDWQVEKDRFERVAYPFALRAAKRAVRGWHPRKQDDGIQEFLAKTWDQWSRLLAKGKDPEPMLWPLLSLPSRNTPNEKRTRSSSGHQYPHTPQLRAGLSTFCGERSMNVRKFELVMPSRLNGSRKCPTRIWRTPFASVRCGVRKTRYCAVSRASAQC